jgi:anthranilate phosphoribosyltransferase
MAQALLKLGVERALVVHSGDGTDEISLASATAVREVRAGEVEAYEVTPEDFGVERWEPVAVRGGDPETNAAILRGVLLGKRGAARDAAVVNAAAALYACGRAESFAAGAEAAGRAIDSGAAAAVLERLRAASQGARARAGSAA